MDWLETLPATGITAVSLVVALFVAQVRGWIYVKGQVDEIRKDRDARLKEVRDDRDARLDDKNKEIAHLWEAYNSAEYGRAVAAEQTAKMLEGLEATVAVVQAIPGTGGRHE